LLARSKTLSKRPDEGATYGFIVGEMKEETDGKEIKAGRSACGSYSHPKESQGKRATAAIGRFPERQSHLRSGH